MNKRMKYAEAVVVGISVNRFSLFLSYKARVY